MPRISAFYGIVIAIGTLDLIGGFLPRRALRLVAEWAGQHEAELAANWQKARTREPLDTIEPLE